MLPCLCPQGPPVVRMGYFTDDGDHDLSVAMRGLRLGMKLELPLARMGLQLDRQSTAAPACRYGLEVVHILCDSIFGISGGFPFKTPLT